MRRLNEDSNHPVVKKLEDLEKYLSDNRITLSARNDTIIIETDDMELSVLDADKRGTILPRLTSEDMFIVEYDMEEDEDDEI